MKRIVIILLLLVASRATADCVMSADDRALLDQSIATWEAVRAEALKLGPTPPPTFILFDPACVWRDGKGTAHSGKIALPDGSEVSAGTVTFAST